jgi:phage terminase large subunit GpA-like protein
VSTVPLIGDWASAAAPPPRLTVSQWADAKRFLPQTSAARGARWRTETTPYLRGIMDAVHEPGVQQIVLEKCAQVGGSEALHNILGYFIEHDPSPMLLVHPTAEVAEEWSKERLNDMIQSTPALETAIRDDESTLTYKVFTGGYLALGGANTPNTFARRAVRVAMGDDVDRFPPVVGEEGDPADLLIDRTTTFHDALALFVSTPTLKFGRIDTLYLRSDQRRYFVTCPGCGHHDWITWSDTKHFSVAFDLQDPETSRLVCPNEECATWLWEPDRRAMVAAGGWKPTATAKEPGLVGFHLPAMVSTLGSVTLSKLVAKFLAARAKGKESLRVFINTTLAEGWEDRGARMEPQSLVNRRESYGDGVEVPATAAALTAGVDVQDNRFELQVIAWGPAGERWVVDWRAIPGNPKLPETRASLLEALSRRYVHALGPELPIHATCVDTGYATEEMYDFVLAHQHRRIYATKGVGGKSGEPIVGKPNEKRYGRGARPVRLYLLNVDDAKASIYESLGLAAPGPGYTHFPAHIDTVDEEYFAQLCAEHRETRYNRSGIATHTVWVQDRDRNEALDTAVMALAAFRLLNPNVRQMLEAVAAAAQATKPPDGTPPAPSSPPQPAPVRTPVRRLTRSSYLGR